MAALRSAAAVVAAITAILLTTAPSGGNTDVPLRDAQATRVAAASPTAGDGASDLETAPNLLANGDFIHGSGKSPDDWRTGGWNESPSVTSYDWLHSLGSEPELIVTNLQPNDARWLQTLSLGPGWYYVGAEARAEDVAPGAAGAYVSLDEDSINSPDLHGGAAWQRLGLYLKVGVHGADVDVALRLGGFSSLNTGRAFFRRARVIKLAALPAGAGPVFDLSAVRKSLVAPPVGKPWTLPAVFVLLAIAAIAGWRAYGTGDLAVAPVLDQQAPSLPRSERRRRDQKDTRRRGGR